MMIDLSMLPPSWQAVLAKVERQSFLLGFGALTAFGVFAVLLSPAPAGSVSTTTVVPVERRTIVSAVKAVGTVTFASEQQLRFNQRGTVAAVAVKEGDTVKQGQLIASLDQASVQSDIRQGQLAIAASQLQLSQLQIDKDKQLIDAQNAADESARQLDQIKNDRMVAQQQLPSDLASATRAVDDKKAALEQAKLDLAKAEDTQYQNIGATAQSILTSSEKLLDSLYSILTRGNAARPQNGNYEIEIDVLLGNDPSLIRGVQFAYYNAVNEAAKMRQDVGGKIVTSEDPAALQAALTQAKSLAVDISDLAEQTYQMMRGASTDTTSFTASDLSAARNSVSANREAATNLITQAETSLSDLSDLSGTNGAVSLTVSAKQNAVQTAENALAQAEENLKVFQTKTPGGLQQQDDSVTAAEQALLSKQAALESIKSSVDVNVQLKQNAIAQQAASLQKTRKQVNDYELRAPFDGVIRHIDYKVGDNLLDTGDTSSVTLENPDELLITILLDQVDVVRVKAGMHAEIVLDAVPNQTLSGSIAAINPTPIQQSGVVSYEVDVRLPTPANLTILSGMTSTVRIDLDRREAVLAVPNLALKRDGRGGVTVLKSDGSTVPVVIGLTDGKYTEVTSGLTESDQVTAVNLGSAASSSSGGSVNPGQIMRLTGGGGGPTR